MEPSVKGNQLNYTKEYIIKNFGEDVLGKLIEQMQPEDRKILSDNIFGATWQPESTFVNLLVAADKTLGKGNYELCRKVGYYIGQQSIPRFYKFFLLFGQPSFVLRNAALFWRQIHSHGHLKVSQPTKNSSLAHLINYAIPHKAFCFTLIGFFQAVLELTGCKNVSVYETKCVTEGADVCEFPGSWK